MVRFGSAGAALIVAFAAAAVIAQEDAAEVVAIAIRDHGLPCTNPRDAEPDLAASEPDERAWTLTCDEDRYRVIFMGDTGARVEKL